MSDQNPKDPWSGRDRQSPPDLVELIGKLFKKKAAKSSSGGGQSPSSEGKAVGILTIVAIIVIAVVWFISGFYIVQPTDQAPVLRFGRYIETVGPGLHWVPRMIESAYPVNVQSIRTVNVKADMLTEDENIVSIEIAVQYRVTDPKLYLFSVVNPDGSLQQVISSAMRQVVGDTTLDSILTTGRQKVRDDIEKVIKTTLAQYHSGIELTDVNLQPAKPPAAVTAAFDDAINAREDRQKYINKAEAYQNKVLSMVKGQEARIIQQADAYKAKVVQQAKGDTARFVALLKPYEQAPKVMRTRMYYDTLSNLFEHTTNIIDNTHGRTMLYLPLDKHMSTAPKDSTAPTDTTTADDLSTGDALRQSVAAVASSNASGVTAEDVNSRPSYNNLGGN